MELTEFAEWLQQEMNRREMSPADLARKGTLTHAQISRVMSQQRGAGLTFFRGVAKALDLPLEVVLEKAGVLRSAGKMLPQVQALNERLLRLPEAQRQAALEVMTGVLKAIEDATSR